MIRDVSFAENIEKARKLLGLSYVQIARRLGLSEEIIRRSHEGRPLIPEIEEKIIESYIRDLGTKLADSKSNNPALADVFVNVVRKFELRLGDAITLFEVGISKKISNASTRHPSPMVVDDLGIWEVVLEDIAKGIGQPSIPYRPPRLVIQYTDDCWYCNLPSPGTQCGRCAKWQNTPD